MLFGLQVHCKIPAQVLQPEFAKRLAASMTSDSTIHVATLAELKAQNVTAQNSNQHLGVESR
jgi:hypothetical protein